MYALQVLVPACVDTGSDCFLKGGYFVRFALVATGGSAGLIFALAGGSPASTEPRTPAHLVSAANRAPHGTHRLSRRRPAYAVTPNGCTADYDTQPGVDWFVGASDGSDFAAGLESGVLAGSSNEACDLETAIGAGHENIVSNENDRSADSFIAGGELNAITADHTFVGAGYANESTASTAFVGGGTYNLASGVGSFVGSGGAKYIGSNISATAGSGNIAGAEDSFVGAGDLNQIGAGGTGSFVGGGGYLYASTGASGPGNQISANDAFIGAGDENAVTGNLAAVVAGLSNAASGGYSFVGGGQSNSNAGANSFIGSGIANSVGGGEAAIGGGSGNSISGAYGTIAGGEGSRVSGTAGAVGGGEVNLATGTAATVPGGYHNVAAGTASFAAGFGAEANANGSFVWSDDSGSTKHLVATHPNQFLARASGGVIIYSNPTLTSGVSLAAGGGAWANLSDRTMKTNVAALDDAAILAKVTALPVSEWSYTSERGVRHIGPMAQDFYAAFRVGEDDRHITTIDEDGVALAAVKALHAENVSLGQANRSLEAQTALLRAQLAALRHHDAAVSERLADLAAGENALQRQFAELSRSAREGRSARASVGR